MARLTLIEQKEVRSHDGGPPDTTGAVMIGGLRAIRSHEGDKALDTAPLRRTSRGQGSLMTGCPAVSVKINSLVLIHGIGQQEIA